MSKKGTTLGLILFLIANGIQTQTKACKASDELSQIIKVFQFHRRNIHKDTIVYYLHGFATPSSLKN